MAIDKQTVSRVAFLAHLKVEDDKMDATAEEFGKILDWVEQMNEVDTEGVEPLSAVNDTALVCREDNVTEGNQAQAIFANAPAEEYGYFVVPKVVE